MFPIFSHLILPENPIFVDPNGLDEQMTSTTARLTHHHRNFRRDIMVRDGEYCVASHSKKMYLQLVLRDRSHCYGEPTSISGINDVKNGIFLRVDLHMWYALGEVAFLK
ncbi:hypothetical protein APHAL10511_003820, partial [Amanita phalloides]